MSQLRRRSNQLGDFMLHLELAAVDLEYVLFTPMKRLGENFNRSCLAGSRGSQQQKHAYRTPFRGKAGAVHAHVRDDFRQRLRLADKAGL